MSFIPENQFAYKPKSNTTCALITLHDSVTKLLEDESCHGAIIISYDFSKAFDTLPHHLLLEKLKALRFPSGFILWLHSYLTNRQQRIRIGGSRSTCLPVTSGVPQGSLLGPFLFLLMCHDISTHNHSSILVQYADDTTVVCPVYVNTNTELLVSNEVAHMKDWASMNGFTLNSAKTQILQINKRSHIQSPISLLSKFHNSIFRVLGVVWSSNLSWSAHFKSVQRVCSKRLYLLRMLKSVVPHDELWQVFDAVIVNALMYSIELFGPLSVEIRTMIYRLYKRAKQIICSKRCMCPFPRPFNDRLNVRISSLLEKAQKSDHPLYPIVPHRNQKGRFTIPFCRTVRRRNCFTVFSVVNQTNVHID